MKKQRKKYAKPINPWDKERIEREREILKNYGLRKKREIWRTEALVRKYRRLARELVAKKDREKEKMLVQKLINLGLLEAGATLDDVLSLTLEKFLERRLETIIYRKGFANSLLQARQLIVHGHVTKNGRKITHPSYLLRKEEEDKIKVLVPVMTKVKESGKGTEG